MDSSKRQFLRAGASAALLSTYSGTEGILFAKSQEKIRIGQIGVSHAHASKLSVYQSSPDYEVVGIVEENAKERAKAEGQAPYRGIPFMSRDELIAYPGLQAVLVETEIKDLLRNAQHVVDAGKHVHIDKPAGESLEAFESILQVAKSKSLVVQMGYMYRYNPGIVLLREFLSKGWLGDIFEVHAVMSKLIDPPARLQHAQYPGGMMFELGCHLIDLVVGVLGEPHSIYSSRKHSSSIDDGLFDNMLAVFEYPRATATVKTTCLEVDGGNRRHFVVCGTKGTFQIEPLDNPKVKLTLLEEQGPYRKGTQVIEFPKYTRYVGDAKEMADCIRQSTPSSFTYEHDLAVQRCVLKSSLGK